MLGIVFISSVDSSIHMTTGIDIDLIMVLDSTVDLDMDTDIIIHIMGIETMAIVRMVTAIDPMVIIGDSATIGHIMAVPIIIIATNNVLIIIIRDISKGHGINKDLGHASINHNNARLNTHNRKADVDKVDRAIVVETKADKVVRVEARAVDIAVKN